MHNNFILVHFFLKSKLTQQNSFPSVNMLHFDYMVTEQWRCSHFPQLPAVWGYTAIDNSVTVLPVVSNSDTVTI